MIVLSLISSIFHVNEEVAYFLFLLDNPEIPQEVNQSLLAFYTTPTPTLINYSMKLQ